jgi:hypothetical protein
VVSEGESDCIFADRGAEEDRVTEDSVGDCLQVGSSREDSQGDCKDETGGTLSAE